MEDKLISIGKAAKMLGVHIDTLREWDSNGKLPSEKTVGNHRRYRLSQITKLINGETMTQKINELLEDPFQEIIEKWKKQMDENNKRIEELVAKLQNPFQEVMEKWKRQMDENNKRIEELVAKLNPFQEVSLLGNRPNEDKTTHS